MSVIVIVLVEDRCILVRLVFLSSEKLTEVAAEDKLRDVIMLKHSVILSLRDFDAGSWGKERTELGVRYHSVQSLLQRGFVALEVLGKDAEVAAHRTVYVSENLLLMGNLLVRCLLVVFYVGSVAVAIYRQLLLIVREHSAQGL